MKHDYVKIWHYNYVDLEMHSLVRYWVFGVQTHLLKFLLKSLLWYVVFNSKKQESGRRTGVGF